MDILLPTSAGTERYEGPGGYLAERTIVEIGTGAGAFGFYRIIIPKGKVSAEHHHERCTELFYLLTPMRVALNGVGHRLPAGTLVVLRPGDRHEEFADEHDVEYLAMKLPYVEGDKVLSHPS